MKSRWIACVAIGVPLLLAARVFPQSASTSAQPGKTTVKPVTGGSGGTPGLHDKTSKLTGCVESGTTAGTFELTNVKGKGAKSDSSMASSSSSADASASSSSSSGRTVKLVAAAGVDLTQHVGHQVEVTGSWNSSSSSSSSASASASASTGGAKEFNVTDMKLVAATCSAGSD
jgi:hypothetical protein